MLGNGRKNHWAIALIILFLTLCIGFLLKNGAFQIPQIASIICDGEYIMDVKEETIEIPGVKGEYKFLYIADLHIIVPSEDVAEQDLGTVEARYNTWAINTNGKHSKDIYKYLIDKINSIDIDAVLMGGDMMDYLSWANWNCFNEGLTQLNKPYLFATADHDSQTYYTNYDVNQRTQLQNEMSQGLIGELEYDDFIILSINESTFQLSETALTEIEKVFKKGKPIIIVTHVPFDSFIDSGLGEKSLEVWGNRKLLWGEGCFYEPNEVTQKLIDMLNVEDTPVVAVLAGHVHYEYICMLNKNVKQYVFNPAYSGEVVLFTIKSEE